MLLAERAFQSWASPVLSGEPTTEPACDKWGRTGRSLQSQRPLFVAKTTLLACSGVAGFAVVPGL
eukprot:12398420-Alexandrium_andersonii.AAC.1